MKFPYILRSRAEKEIRRLRDRLGKAKATAAKAKTSAAQAKASAARAKATAQEYIQALAEQQSQEVWDTHVAQLRSLVDLRTLFARKLTGEGIEIGALHRPLPVPPGVKVSYVDRHTREDNIARFPHLPSEDMVETTYFCDGQTLETVPDASQDFVIANHMLEHCVNPLEALRNFLRVLRPQGYLFICLPDKRFTFDLKRAVTPWDHVLADFKAGREVEDRAVYEEFRDCVEPGLDVDMAVETRYEIHHHVWTQAEALELFIELRRTLGWTVEIELFGKQGCEIVLLARKDDPVHQDHALLAKG